MERWIAPRLSIFLSCCHHIPTIVPRISAFRTNTLSSKSIAYLDYPISFLVADNGPFLCCERVLFLCTRRVYFTLNRSMPTMHNHNFLLHLCMSSLMTRFISSTPHTPCCHHQAPCPLFAVSFFLDLATLKLHPLSTIVQFTTLKHLPSALFDLPLQISHVTRFSIPPQFQFTIRR